MLSTHKVETVRIKLEPHPNADSLSIINVFGGYPCCVRTADWEDGDLAAYIPPDSIVDVGRPEFEFLKKGERTHHRVRCVKLRGVPSFGLLVKAPDWAGEGDDLAEHLGVSHYEPEIHGGCKLSGDAESAPPQLVAVAKYDIDALRRHSRIFEPGEPVCVTEKIHGANARYCYLDGRMWCGSRSEWKRQEPGSAWWRALEVHPEIEQFCLEFPGYVLFGEVYGRVQNLHYGVPRDVRFMAFDVLAPNGRYWDALVGRAEVESRGVPVVPLIHPSLPYSLESLAELAEGPSFVPGANHVREGVVVKARHERWHQSIGRVILKLVGAGYLEKE